jgi:hypothetical protein
MIQKYYAAHIKNMISAASVNVRKVRPKRRQQPAPAECEHDDLLSSKALIQNVRHQ